MARPERNNVDYFPFLCKEGKAMYFIEQTYGNDGYATWIKILRQLAVTNYHYLNMNDNIEFMFLSSKCKVSPELLTKIIEDLCKLNELDYELWNEYKIIYSKKFIENISDAYHYRKNKCMSYEGLIHHLHSLGIVKHINNSVKHINNTHNIVYNSIKEESSVTHIQTLGIDFVKSYTDLPDEFKQMYDETFYKSWLNINKYLNENCEFLRTWDNQIKIKEFKKIYDRIQNNEITINQVKQALSDLDCKKQAKDNYNSVYHGFNVYIKNAK